MDWIIKILGALGGLIGTVLGIYNFVHARRREQQAHASEEKDWQNYAKLREMMLRHDVSVFVPEEDDEHRWAERMVAKGLLYRGADGTHYSLTPPG